MGDVLRQLALQDVLFLLGFLQALVYLYYTLCNLAEFVAGKVNKVFGVETLVVVGTARKEAQLGDVVAKTAHKAVKDKDKHKHGHEREPQIMLVGTQSLGKTVVVGQGTAHNERALRDIGGRIEIVLIESGAYAAEVVAAAVLECLSDLPSRKMVAHLLIVLIYIVIDDLSAAVDKRNAQTMNVMVGHVAVERLVRPVVKIAQRLHHTLVVILQARVERVDFILTLTCVLKDDEGHSEDHKYGQHADVKTRANRCSAHFHLGCFIYIFSKNASCIEVIAEAEACYDAL